MLRLTSLIHEIYKPPKNGNGNGHGAPTSTSFIRPPQAAPASTETGPDDGPPNGGLLDANGQEYVAG